MANNNVKPPQPKPSSLLIKALNQQEFFNDLPFVSLTHDQLVGVITVDPLERNEILALINDFNLSDSMAFSRGDPQPLYFAKDHFIWSDGVKSYLYRVGYDASNDNTMQELLTTLMVLKSKHTTIGFCKVSIFHEETDQDKHSVILHIDELYVHSEYRNRSNWIDLTCGARTFLGVILECLIASIDENERLNFYFNGGYTDENGNEVGYILTQELNLVLEELMSNYSTKSSCYVPAMVMID